MSIKYFRNLDGLRYILALIFFFGHSRLGESLESISHFDFIDRIIRVFSAGHLAVSFFFTLSGFLITYLIIREKEDTGKFSIRNFYFRRILRIWPVFFSVLFFSFYVYPTIKTWLGYEDHNPFHLLYQILFFSNFDNIAVARNGLIDTAPMMISINWSIAVEEQFYLFWPLLFLLSGAKRFWVLITLVILLSWYYRAFLLQGQELYYHTFAVVSDLAIGALTAFVCFYSFSFIRKLEQIHPALILGAYFFGFYILMYPEEFSFLHAGQRIVHSLFFSFIILEQNFAKRSLYKFGNNATLTSMGKYSYSFYLLHPIAIQISIISFRYFNLHVDGGILYALLYVAIAFTCSTFLTWLSYTYLESFFLKLKGSFVDNAVQSG